MSDVLPRIEIPPIEPVPPAEIERRRKLFDEIMRLREEMPLFGI